jgi:periplasmic protein TonB
MKPMLLFCLCASFLTSTAQDKNQFFALDANMNQTVLDSSKYMLWIHQKEDSNWQWDYYKTWGPLVKSTDYADHDGKILNGHFYIYNTMGNLDSMGVYDHGRKTGSFYKFRSYTKDSIVSIMQYDYLNDSLTKAITIVHDVMKISDSTGEKESEFPGGIRAWYTYLVHNLIYPDRAISKKIQGQVQIRFIVDTSGNVLDPYIQKSLEYSLDQTALKLVKDSGKWIPALKDGIPVKSYKSQPLNFKLEFN